jgi:DNA-binding MarR family transcriptional regulator
MVGHLERKGLIERTPDSRNRRILRMTLTKDGAKVVKSCNAWMDELEGQMLAGLTTRDAKELRKILQTCVGNLEAQRVLDGV